jgi:hypothetical protein
MSKLTGYIAGILLLSWNVSGEVLVQFGGNKDDFSMPIRLTQVSVFGTP